MAQEQINVNEHRRAFQQHKRSGVFELQGILEGAAAVEPWWKKYFRWEPLTVAGRTIEKGWVVPQPLGIALIIVMLGGVGSLYWRVTDAISGQSRETRELRELVIRLDERMIQKDNSDKERFNDFKQEIEGAKSHQAAIESVMNKQFAELKSRR